MTFPLTPLQPAVDDNSTISAATVNAWRAYIASALDGVGGSNGVPSEPSTPIEIGGAGLKLVDNGQLAYNARDVQRQESLSASTNSNNWSLSTVIPGAWRNTASGGLLYVWMNRLIHGAALTRLTVRWVGASGHGALPTMPVWTLYRVDGSGTSTTVATATDTSASVLAYETAHAISNNSITHTVDLSTYRYVLEMQGETGGNFVANAQLLQVFTTHSVTAQSEG